jgi:hypothetical protein
MPFLGRFGRKRAIRVKENDTFFVLCDFLGHFVLQTVASQDLTAIQTPPKKSYLKTYGRFFGFWPLW